MQACAFILFRGRWFVGIYCILYAVCWLRLQRTSAWTVRFGGSICLRSTCTILHRVNDHVQGVRYTSALFSVSSSANDTLSFASVEELLESGPEQLSTCRHVESPSLKSLNRAIEQVRALFDLARPHAGAEAISPGLALSVLEGLVRRALPTITSSADASSIDECDQSLQAMEELLGRVDELHAHPSIQTVESVWMIQQYQWQRTSGTSCDPSNKSRQAKQLDRTIALLRNWTIWSCFSGMALSGRPPPPLFLLKVLQTASQAGLVMTDQLWDLVERLILNETPRQLCRDVHSQLLDVLSYSGSRWDHYQCRVLQRMLRYSIDDERDHSSRASIAKLLIRAMRASSQAGRVPDTAWLARQLLCLNCTFAEGDPTFNEEAIRMLFLKSLQYSDDPGSLLYMERLVLTDRDDSFLCLATH
jgi:hypothetical protein